MAGLLEAACEVQERELIASCMALVEAQTEEVLASDGFAAHLSEDTLCRVLASDKLNVKEEISLYFAVAAWGAIHAQRDWCAG